MKLTPFAIVRDAKFPFLTLKKIHEDDPRRPDILLNSDEQQDYEDTTSKWILWQNRLADADYVGRETTSGA